MSCPYEFMLYLLFFFLGQLRIGEAWWLCNEIRRSYTTDMSNYNAQTCFTISTVTSRIRSSFFHFVCPNGQRPNLVDSGLSSEKLNNRRCELYNSCPKVSGDRRPIFSHHIDVILAVDGYWVLHNYCVCILRWHIDLAFRTYLNQISNL